VLDPRVCYQALRTRDERFDGRFFVGVVTTGIYCRPICPATTAKRENCRFFPSAAAAQEAGFRPCLRCRPETAPDAGAWRGTSNTVSRALALIADGALDGDDASVDALADRLGVGARQLRRLFDKHLGASPIAVAQTRRVLFAKQLIHDTEMPMADVALAAGFGSVRRFNETFQRLFERPPSAIRRKAPAAREPSRGAGVAGGGGGGGVGGGGGGGGSGGARAASRIARAVSVAREPSVATAASVRLRLRYRPPYDWGAVLGFLRARAVDGVERADDRGYARTLWQDGLAGTVEIVHLPRARSLEATIRFPCVRALPGVVARVRRLFDLGADATAIGAHLARDPMLAPLVATRPGLRVPGAWDGFETAVRAILGQQISVEAARRLGARLVAICGAPVESADPALSRAFPDPAALAGADLAGLGMPDARRRALVAVARAALADPSLFAPRASADDGIARLRGIPGIGEWTAQYIALRAMREPDAFPASDVGLLRGVEACAGARPAPSELLSRAERWRPWRAYAAQHLWAADEKG
jgi:AraC family transcriptional regulator of adaptative response / DNA-3-methyladenine glycosylase II